MNCSPVRQMQRDVAAIVDIGAIERRLAQHRAENFLRHAAGDRRHRRDEMIGGKRRHRRMHAARDLALQQALRRIGGLTQQRQLVAEFVEQTGEAASRGVIGRAHARLAATRLHDQVDRTILQMQPPAVRQPSDLRQSLHARDPDAGCGGVI